MHPDLCRGCFGKLTKATEIVMCGEERANDRELRRTNPVFTPPRIRRGDENWPQLFYDGFLAKQKLFCLSVLRRRTRAQTAE